MSAGPLSRRVGLLLALLLVALSTRAQSGSGWDETKVSEPLARAVLASREGAYATFPPSASGERMRADSHVAIDAIAHDDGAVLLDALLELGLRGAERHGRLVSGRLPTHLLGALDGIGPLRSVRPGSVRFATGAVTSEGDRGMRSDTARDRFDVDGEGVTVGVISDSYDCLGGAAADIASGDLPADARVLREADDCASTRDEGRALMQIVHDIAPGAELLFRSGASGTAGIANAVLELADAGADVVVDDVAVPTTSWFQHGPIARAVLEIEASGVVHVTAAGNEARLSYDSAYRDTRSPALGLRFHDFDPGPAVDALQGFELPEGGLLELVLQWDEPAFSNNGPPGAASDLDVYVTDASGIELLGGAALDNIGSDPVEHLTFVNPPRSGRTRFNLMIVTGSGASPGRLKTLVLGRFAGHFVEHATASSTIVGHANTDAAIAVGAVDQALAVARDGDPPPLRAFSSAGGTPILFDRTGARYTEPRVPAKPDIAAPDGVSTTFFSSEGDGSPVFVGTSASAPHVAGVVALLLEARTDLAPADVRALLAAGAVDIVARDGDGPSAAGPGFDADSGHGLLDAEATLALAGTFESSAQEPLEEDSSVAHVDKVSVSGGVGFWWLVACTAWVPLRRAGGALQPRSRTRSDHPARRSRLATNPPCMPPIGFRLPDGSNAPDDATPVTAAVRAVGQWSTGVAKG